MATVPATPPPSTTAPPQAPEAPALSATPPRTPNPSSRKSHWPKILLVIAVFFLILVVGSRNYTWISTPSDVSLTVMVNPPGTPAVQPSAKPLTTVVGTPETIVPVAPVANNPPVAANNALPPPPTDNSSKVTLTADKQPSPSEMTSPSKLEEQDTDQSQSDQEKQDKPVYVNAIVISWRTGKLLYPPFKKVLRSSLKHDPIDDRVIGFDVDHQPNVFYQRVLITDPYTDGNAVPVGTIAYSDEDGQIERVNVSFSDVYRDRLGMYYNTMSEGPVPALEGSDLFTFPASPPRPQARLVVPRPQRR